MEKSSVPLIVTMSNMRIMDITEFEIDTAPSPNDPPVGAHVGVRIRYKILNLTVESTSQKTQYANRKNAMKMLEEKIPVIEI